MDETECSSFTLLVVFETMIETLQTMLLFAKGGEASRSDSVLSQEATSKISFAKEGEASLIISVQFCRSFLFFIEKVVPPLFALVGGLVLCQIANVSPVSVIPYIRAHGIPAGNHY